MAKRVLTQEQKEAKKERARKRREARKAAAAGTPAPETDKKPKAEKPVKTLPEVLKQVTFATTEEELLAPVKKTRKSKRESAEKEPKKKSRKSTECQSSSAPQLVLLPTVEGIKEHKFHRFADNDDYKSVYYMVRTKVGSNLMRGLFCKIDKEGKIDPSEYNKLEKARCEAGFIGFVKEHGAK